MRLVQASSNSQRGYDELLDCVGLSWTQEINSLLKRIRLNTTLRWILRGEIKGNKYNYIKIASPNILLSYKKTLNWVNWVLLNCFCRISIFRNLISRFTFNSFIQIGVRNSKITIK